MVTFAPSTTSSAGNETDAPTAASMRSTVIVSPTVTFSWRPPALTIAYMLIASVLVIIYAQTSGQADAKGTDFIPRGSNWGLGYAVITPELAALRRRFPLGAVISISEVSASGLSSLRVS